MEQNTQMPTAQRTSSVPRPSLRNMRRMTLGEIERDQSSSVFVFNNTKPRGDIMFSALSGAGSTISVKVPISWIPYDLTTAVTKKTLLENPDFRRLLALGAIVVVSTSEYERIMEHPDAHNEQVRQMQVVRNFNTGSLSATASNLSDDNFASGRDSKDDLREQIAAEQNNQISGLAMTIASSDASEASVLDQLESRSMELSSEDLTYIANKATHASVKEAAARLANEA